MFSLLKTISTGSQISACPELPPGGIGAAKVKKKNRFLWAGWAKKKKPVGRSGFFFIFYKLECTGRGEATKKVWGGGEGEYEKKGPSRPFLAHPAATPETTLFKGGLNKSPGAYSGHSIYV